MADFYRGFVYEYSLKGSDAGDWLRIEGNYVELTSSGSRFSAQLPAGEIVADSLPELARLYIEGSEALKLRATIKAHHLNHLREKKDKWNLWRRENREIQPMLACLEASELEGQSLAGYDLSYANLTSAKLRHCNLERVNFHQAILADANLTGAHLKKANFCRTDLYKTILKDAHLEDANLQGVQLAQTDLSGAHLRGCTVYGLSAWDLTLDGADQTGLLVRYQPFARDKERPEQTVAVDSLNLAAFIYLAVNNSNLPSIVDAAARKWVLLLGRFAPKKRKTALEKIAAALKEKNFIPIVFDFPKPKSRDLIETIVWLAGMSAFVIADITDPRSTPMELLAIASSYAVPIVPIVQGKAKPFATFFALRRFTRVHDVLHYQTPEAFIEGLDEVLAWASDNARHKA